MCQLNFPEVLVVITVFDLGFFVTSLWLHVLLLVWYLLFNNPVTRKVTVVLKVLHLYSLPDSWLVSKLLLWNSFVTLSSPMSIGNLSSKVFKKSNFCVSWHISIILCCQDQIFILKPQNLSSLNKAEAPRLISLIETQIFLSNDWIILEVHTLYSPAECVFSCLICLIGFPTSSFMIFI